MLEDYFPEIKTQIDEYYEFSNIVRSDKQLFAQYPKILNLSISSLFENQIKRLCADIVDNPKHSVFSDVALQNFVRRSRNKYIDKIYGLIWGYIDTNGQEVLSMQNFYDLFGGIVFEQRVEMYFMRELPNQIHSYEEFLAKVSACVLIDSKYESSYIFADAILQQLKANTFQIARDSFLRLKERRNRIAHDFMCSFNDTYNDIVCLYNKAALFVYALKKALWDLIDL